jgi:3-oxoacyl-[acyl-carrier-protein] synthase III
MTVELANAQVRRIPGVAVAYGGVGRPVTNPELWGEFEGRFQSDKDRQEARISMDGSGIILRYRPADGKLYSDAPELLRPETIGAASALTRKTLEANGWDKADYLIGVTSFPPDAKSQWVGEVAAGFGIREFGEVNATCNGSALAMVEVLKNPALRGSRVVIAAYEPLGRFTDPNDFMSQVIFGSGGAAIAFDPGSFKLLGAKTMIQQDTEGVIKVPKSYEVPGLSRQDKLPDWFVVEPGSEGIVSYSDRLVRITLPEPERDKSKLEMSGQGTARYFTKLVADALIDNLVRYYGETSDALSNPIGLSVGHQPSKPVFSLVERRLKREIAGNDQLRGVTPPEMPWLLEKARMSNISPGTFLVALAESLGRIESQDKLFTGLGYGVGSSWSAFTAQYLN